MLPNLLPFVEMTGHLEIYHTVHHESMIYSNVIMQALLEERGAFRVCTTIIVGFNGSSTFEKGVDDET